MKSLTRSLLLALALTTGAWVPVQAQTFEQSYAAFERKDYGTAFAGYQKSPSRGVPIDEQSAYFWWLLASAQGVKMP